jgi:phosphatidylglycerophosphate synthase
VSEAPRLEIAVGRYYWHRIQKLSDRRAAKKKILLATMKPTDGVYARTNRRVSLAISHGLVETPVTPNAVTLITLLCSVSAAVFFAVGTYPSMVAGAFVSWFASMLDGVDGELARSKFLHSDFGCWLEMVCDYLYYVFVFTGIGVGLYRSTDNIVWLVMGVGSVIGVILGFSVIAAQRKKYSRANETSEFGLAFQKTVERQKGSVVYRFIRTVNFLATRAAMPYYIAFFTVLGLVKVLLVLIFVGTNLTWTLTGYASRLKLTLEDKPDRRQAV